MDLRNYILLSVLVSLSPLIGYVMSFYVKEELKTFLKVSKFVKIAVVFYLLGIILMAKLPHWALVVFIFGLLLLEILKHDSIFFVLGIMFFLVSVFNNLVLYGTLGLFLYGLFYGIAMAKQPLKRVVIASVTFLLTTSVFLLIAVFH